MKSSVNTLMWWEKLPHKGCGSQALSGAHLHRIRQDKEKGGLPSVDHDDKQGCAEMAIGDNIRKIRENKGLSAEKAAELCGIAPSTFAKYERGETQPTASPIRLIAKGLGVSTDEILLESDERSVSAELTVLLQEVSGLTQTQQAEVRRAIKGLLLVYHQERLN
jgi:transcriptional regulator with XRE-family HTH domain